MRKQSDAGFWGMWYQKFGRMATFSRSFAGFGFDFIFQKK